MKKIIMIALITMLSSVAFAADYNETITGSIVDVRPHYSSHTTSTPEQVCTQSSNQSNDMAMGIIGGIIGGVVGNQVGRGQGKTAATIGGAIVGNQVGGRYGNRSGGNQQNCHTVYHQSSQQVVDYSEITVDIGEGRYFTTKSYSNRYRIGDRVRVSVAYSLR